jgi:hypothetical protein
LSYSSLDLERVAEDSVYGNSGVGVPIQLLDCSYKRFW